MQAGFIHAEPHCSLRPSRAVRPDLLMPQRVGDVKVSMPVIYVGNHYKIANPRYKAVLYSKSNQTKTKEVYIQIADYMFHDFRSIRG